MVTVKLKIFLNMKIMNVISIILIIFYYEFYYSNIILFYWIALLWSLSPYAQGIVYSFGVSTFPSPSMYPKLGTPLQLQMRLTCRAVWLNWSRLGHDKNVLPELHFRVMLSVLIQGHCYQRSYGACCFSWWMDILVIFLTGSIRVS